MWFYVHYFIIIVIDNCINIILMFAFLCFLQPYWLKSREFWDDSFDERYKKLHEDVINKKRLPLKVSFKEVHRIINYG